MIQHVTTSVFDKGNQSSNYLFKTETPSQKYNQSRNIIFSNLYIMNMSYKVLKKNLLFMKSNKKKLFKRSKILQEFRRNTF